MTSYRITLPAGLPLLNANARQHHHPRARITAALRDAACVMARQARVPAMPYAHVVGIIHPDSRRRLDPANLYPSFKAAVDGLVDARVLWDDDSEHVIGPDMRRGHVVRGGQLVLILHPLTAGQHARLATGEVPLLAGGPGPHDITGVAA